MLEALFGLGAAGALHAALDSSAWKAYESVEEAWIRDRHSLLVQQSPQAASAAQIDLELKLAELKRRAMQFKHLARKNPRLLRGGIWQLSWLPFTERERTQLGSLDPEYGRHEEKIRKLGDTLRSHPGYEVFREAQTKLWKTSEYREIHRTYSTRMEELHRTYGGTDMGAFAE